MYAFDEISEFYQKNKDQFLPFNPPIDYKKYPVLLLGENMEHLQTIKDSLEPNFTVEIATDIEKAKKRLTRDNTIRLALVVQGVSHLVDQDVISEILADNFPLTKIVLKFTETRSEWDKLINQFQVIKHAFNSSSPQVLKAEIRKGIEEAILMEEKQGSFIAGL